MNHDTIQTCGYTDVRKAQDGRYVCSVCRTIMGPDYLQRVAWGVPAKDHWMIERPLDAKEVQHG